MPKLPARQRGPEVLPPLPSNGFGREVVQATREAQSVAAMRAAVDQADTHALGSALQVSLDAEAALFDYGLSRAGGSVVKAEIVARKVEMFSTINNARIRRRFGG
jgi:hypothetical protein